MLVEVRNAAFCALASLLIQPYPARVVLWSAAAWFLGQGIDELTMGNLFKDGYWEYGALTVLGSLTYAYLRYHDSTRAKDP